MHSFDLKILTPDTTVFSGKVLSCNLPTRDGEITILSNHAPLVSVMSIGEVKVKLEDESLKTFVLQGGVLKVSREDKSVTLLSDTQIDLTTFVEADLQKEIDRAKAVMNESVDESEFANFEGQLERYFYLDKVLKRKG